MSGQNKKDVLSLKTVDKEASFPNGIYLDREERHVFWVDARSNSIHKVDYDGENHILIKKFNRVLHPFSLAWNRGRFFWSATGG